MHRNLGRAGLFLATACLAAIGGARAADAQEMASLADSVVPLGAGVAVAGEADASSIVHFQVALRLRDKAALDASNRAGFRLTASQLESRHLPGRAEHAAVVAWLRGQGLTVESTLSSRLAISVSGRADVASRALGVHFSRIIADRQIYVSADSVPSIPAALAGIVLSINGLQPQLHAIRLGIAKPAAVRPLASGGVTPLYPSDLLTAYAANNVGTTGAGMTTAIVIDTFPKTSDLTKFWSITGVPQSLANYTFIQAVAGTLPALSGEESLDAQYAGGMAPSSKVRVYATHTLSFADIDTGYQKIISDLQAGVAITQVTISLGACETSVGSGELNTDDGYFATMTALGATVFVSSGDSGSRECGGRTNVPSFFSTSPNVTAVGGTTLKLNSNSTIRSETSWNGSGGGVSTFFAKPSYQSALSYAKRAVPDVSADANPNTGVLVIVNGASNQYGGTSVSSPVWAGLAALINAARSTAGKPTLGLLGPRVYPLLRTANFRDITTGNNGGYTAAVGYDLVTGIGTPVMSTLLPTLVAQP